MPRLLRLIFCVSIVGGLSLGLVHGAIWLVNPDPGLRAQAPAMPLARHARTFHRTGAFVPAAVESMAAAAPTPKPAMNQAPVSLTDQPPQQTFRESNRALKRKRNETRGTIAKARERAAPAVVAPAFAVTTARSDVPY